MTTSTTALLIHGADDTTQIWDPVVTRLTELGTVATVGDYPWGRLGDPAWSARASAGRLVRSDLATTRPDVCVAHSFGCIALLEAMVDLPAVDLPRAVVLVAPFYLARSEPMTWELVDRTRSEFADLMRRAVGSRSMAVGRRLSAESAELIADKLVSGMNPLGFITLFQGFAMLRERDLESIGVPTEIIAAREDPGLTGNRRKEELAERLGARLTTTDGNDHFLHYNDPDLVVEAITRSLPRTTTTERTEQR